LLPAQAMGRLTGGMLAALLVLACSAAFAAALQVEHRALLVSIQGAAAAHTQPKRRAGGGHAARGARAQSGARAPGGGVMHQRK
jgi:hypothetical protein